MMMSSIRPRTWESKSALLAHLGGISGRTILLGTEAEAPRTFYSLAISCAQGTCEVGVLSSGLGIEPEAAVMERERRVIVGHDAWITWLDLDSMIVLASLRLDGVFYEFLPLDRSGELLVLHELGVVRVDAHGSVLWSVHTDVVEHAGFDADGNLVITALDAPGKVLIAIESGTVLSNHEIG